MGPSPSVPSFDNLLNNQPGNQVTAPPGWRDPLDQIFGITTSSPVITASVASNTLVCNKFHLLEDKIYEAFML